MMWLTWRQFRAQAIVTSTALVIAAVVLAITGLQLAHLYGTSGIAGCQAHSDCATLATRFQAQLNAGSTYKLVDDLGTALLFALPAIIGVFWGAPLIARELEAGTFRLAWNQSVTQTRWLAIKIGLVGLASMAAAGLLSLMLTWWATPIERAAGLVSGPVSNQLEPTIFGARGIAPMGYALFAFALGVAVGVVIRRTIPAMAVTLVVFAFVQIIMSIWVRPHLIEPARRAVVLSAAALSSAKTISVDNGALNVGVNIPGAWVLSTSQATNSAGHLVNRSIQACSYVKSFDGCIAKLKLHVLVTYQPANRFWAFQWYETAIFVGVSVLLAGFCFWRIRRQA